MNEREIQAKKKKKKKKKTHTHTHTKKSEKEKTKNLAVVENKAIIPFCLSKLNKNIKRCQNILLRD